MLLIGLTGSIATGKSTVSKILSSAPYSLPVIDADLLARQVVAPGTRGYTKIVNHFGSTTSDLLYPDRTLNRPALGRRVFGDSEERIKDRKVLNGIVHPAVRWEMVKLAFYYYIRGHWAVVLDIPLLFESGLDIFCGTVVVVAVSDPNVQLQRLRDRDEHLSQEEAANRVRSQGDVKGKVERVQRGMRDGRGWIVWNNEGREELDGEVRRVMEGIRRGSPGWWGWLLLVLTPLGIGMGMLDVVRAWIERSRWMEQQAGEKLKM